MEGFPPHAPANIAYPAHNLDPNQNPNGWAACYPLEYKEYYGNSNTNVAINDQVLENFPFDSGMMTTTADSNTFFGEPVEEHLPLDPHLPIESQPAVPFDYYSILQAEQHAFIPAEQHAFIPAEQHAFIPAEYQPAIQAEERPANSVIMDNSATAGLSHRAKNRVEKKRKARARARSNRPDKLARSAALNHPNLPAAAVAGQIAPAGQIVPAGQTAAAAPGVRGLPLVPPRLPRSRFFDENGKERIPCNRCHKDYSRKDETRFHLRSVHYPYYYPDDLSYEKALEQAAIDCP
ncbi:hypothetical protein EsH8_VI_000057 [Colletotrichum jinshuiense]